MRHRLGHVRDDRLFERILHMYNGTCPSIGDAAILQADAAKEVT